MASLKYLFPFSFFLLLLCESTIALRNFNLPQHYTPFDQHCNGLARLARNGTNIALVEVKDVVRSLRDHGGYDIMAMMLERNLRFEAFPFCGRDFAFFVDRRNRMTFYGRNPTVTLFVPSDRFVLFEDWADLGYQIAMAKIDQEAFVSGDLSEGSKFDPASFSTRRLVVDRVFDNGTVSINEVKIKEWDIYNDGNIIVHGTEGFFELYRGDGDPYEGLYASVIIKKRTDWYELNEDPNNGSYVTKKMFIDDPESYAFPEDQEIVQLSSIQLLL